MSRKQHSGIFMMEMIMVVFFFILCSSVCILVFVKGDRMSRDAADLNQSVLIAQSVAEVWKLEGPEGLKQRFGASVSTQDDASGSDGNDAFKTDGDEAFEAVGDEAAGNRYVMEFDKNGNLAEDSPEGGGDGSASGKIYTAVLSADEAESSAEITVSREKNSVYKLSVSRHEREQG